ncbi:PilZ domain-containing protein [Thiohalorhabdus sp. Cl-TMA]|uniref:PilZ domain-containing protein n=1 Tax=Thiohalorhabdus methylotrophus TaxID=3242694 RepID=A0ABV4TRD0_9GAMM
MQEQIQDFKDLLARIDGLVNAAWAARVDPLLARQLAAVRQRLVRIQAHLTGEANPAFPAPEPSHQSVQDSEDLVTRFSALVDASKGSGLSSTLTHYLHNARLRLTFFLRGAEHRLASRQLPEPGRSVQLEWPDGAAEGTLLDTSAFGIGIETDTPLEPDGVIRVTVADPDGASRTYECVVVHCRPLDSGYHLGLEIFTTKL